MNKEYLLSQSIALFRSTKINNLDSKYVKSSEFSILILITNFETISNITPSVIVLSKYLNCSKAYVGRITNILCDKGLIYKSQNTKDARQFYLYPTLSGKQIVTNYMEKYMETTNYLYHKLGDQKAEELRLLLLEATKIINEYDNK